MGNSKRKGNSARPERYFPPGAHRYRYEALHAEWAISGSGASSTLIAYHGRRKRFDFYRSYRSEFALEADLSRWLDELASRVHRRAQAQREAAERMAETIRGLAPGGILFRAWGYDQTNVEFYKILAVRGKKVQLVEVASVSVHVTRHLSERVVPDANALVGTPFWKVVRPTGLRMDHGSLRLWDGTPQERSWTH
jgi:hypothetical protein